MENENVKAEYANALALINASLTAQITHNFRYDTCARLRGR
jgi:hypothetical protein